MPALVIAASHLRKTYRSGDQDLHALRRPLRSTFAEGEYAAIMGASGPGKSTLMNILGALDRPTTGSYSARRRACRRDERQAASARCATRKIGFASRASISCRASTPSRTWRFRLVYARVSPNERHARARASARARWAGRADAPPPHGASGGQQQRVRDRARAGHGAAAPPRRRAHGCARQRHHAADPRAARRFTRPGKHHSRRHARGSRSRRARAGSSGCGTGRWVADGDPASVLEKRRAEPLTAGMHA